MSHEDIVPLIITLDGERGGHAPWVGESVRMVDLTGQFGDWGPGQNGPYYRPILPWDFTTSSKRVANHRISMKYDMSSWDSQWTLDEGNQRESKT